MQTLTVALCSNPDTLDLLVNAETQIFFWDSVLLGFMFGDSD